MADAITVTFKCSVQRLATNTGSSVCVKINITALANDGLVILGILIRKSPLMC